MKEKTEAELTRDIFTHIRQILERDGDKAEIMFNAIQLRKILDCAPMVEYRWPDDLVAPKLTANNPKLVIDKKDK